MEINLTFHVIAHANGMKTRSGDILDAYLQVDAKKVFIKRKPETSSTHTSQRMQRKSSSNVDLSSAKAKER
jgi:hypothetical protein